MNTHHCKFTHLAIRTEYSIVDSIVRLPDLIKVAKQDGQNSLGIADMSNVFAVVKFYKACTNAGIKPLIGTEMTIGESSDKGAYDNQHTVILYAMDNNGYKNLLKTISKGYTDGLVDGLPIITQKDLFAQNHGLIAILTERSEINTPLKGKYPERCQKILEKWKNAFGDRLYIGIKRTKRAGEDLFIKNAITQAATQQIPLIAFNDVRFINKSEEIQAMGDDVASDDFDAHEARVCITGGYVLADTTRPHHYSKEQYFKSQDEMAQLFADIDTVLANTNALANRCNVTLSLGKSVLPDFPIPDGYSIEGYFKQVSFEGLHNRLEVLYPQNARDENWPQIHQKYETRLNYELGIINQMGFAGYFLIVMDFIRWAKENGVPVGPGRGSGAGSLVAYSLNITDLDPLAYDLLFERFLNPERVSMPDFDIDFCIEGRDRVIDYVANTYGREAVSQIITFGTMAARAVIRDVARVQGKSYGLADRISKLIPKTPGISLQEAYQSEQQLQQLLTDETGYDYSDAQEIWQMALKLEGLTRNVGKHAGGVLIAPNSISDFSAVYCDDEGGRISQFDKGDVEAVGLVKFDFLGLRNLTVIKAALDNINERRQKLDQPPLILEELPLDDEAVYKNLLQEAKTTAVFQLESNGMKKYLEKLKPTNIEDVIAMCALYRPGPLESGMVEDFIKRKQDPNLVAYPHEEYQHESLKPALDATYGIIVYQEQVMQIAQTLSGYTLGEADMLRRAMGKKNAAEMALQKENFVNGAIKNGIDGKLAENIFQLIEYFAGYGFNKSHSAAYGLLAYQTSYLKHYYPAEFMAAVLTSEMSNTDSVVFLIDDCKENFNLQVLPPSVNKSAWEFVVNDSNAIIYGLGAVKGVGEAAVENIIQARGDGEFDNLYDFCNRVDIKKVGKRTLEGLIKAGCFDDLAPKLRPNLNAQQSYEIRGALWAQLPLAMKAAEQNRNNKNSHTDDLFAGIDDALVVAPPLPDVLWRTQDRLNFELDTLGLYLTGHPIDDYRDELKRYTSIPKLADFSPTIKKGYVSVAGLITDIANFGNRVVIFLDDGTARLEISCFTDKYNHLKDILKIKSIVVVKIATSEYNDRIYVRLQNASTLVAERLKHIKVINIKIHKEDTQTLEQIIPLLKPYNPPQDIAVYNDNDEDGDHDELTHPKINDGCIMVNFYVYDNNGISKINTNDNCRMHPSDDNWFTLCHILPKDQLKFG